MGNELDKERDSTDAYLNTAAITLIAGYLVLFSITKFNSCAASWLAISSLACFILTLLFNLWYRVRRALKKEILDKRMKDFYDSEAAVIINYAQLIQPTVTQKFIEVYKDHLTEPVQATIGELQAKVNKPQLDEKFTTEIRDLLLDDKSVFRSLSENSFNKMLSIRTEIQNKPLNEKYARLKFLIDYLSFNTRYYLFCLGLVLFLSSIILNNLQNKV